MLPQTHLEILHIQTHGHVIAVLTTWKTTGVFSQQAKALWRLSNFQHSRLNKTKTAVRINLDETSVCLTQCEKRGWLLPEVRKRMWRGESVTGEVKTKAMKTNFSHVCMICDNPDINTALPQVLIFKEDVMSGELLQALKDVAPKHWVLLRQPKAWCNNEAMKKVLAKLESNLADYRSTHEFILIFDTFRSHICAPTLKSLGNMGLSTVIIPAKTTSLLQPLDVYGFAQYKRSLRLKSMLRRLSFPREVNTWRRMVDILVSTTIEVLVKKNWSFAFQRLGLSGDQTTLSTSARARLQFTDHPETLPAQFPTLAELKELFPDRSIIPIDALFQVHRGPVSLTVGKPKPPIPKESVCLTPPSGGVWFGRTRSTSHKVLPVPEPSSLKEQTVSSSSTLPWRPRQPTPRSLPKKSSK